MHKIYRKGNYIFYIDPSMREFVGGLSDVKIVMSLDKSEIDIYGLKLFNQLNQFGSEGKKTVPMDSLYKLDNSPYTLMEFEDFYTENTGNLIGTTNNTTVSFSGASIAIENSVPSVTNNTTTPLNSGDTFTGTGELNTFPDVMITTTTDKKGMLYCEFSPDGSNWDTSLSFDYDPVLINPPHILVKGYRYFRVRFVNTSGENQSYLRLNVSYGMFNKLTNTLNSLIPQSFDATVTRPIDFNLLVAKNLYQGHQLTVKDGITSTLTASNDTTQDVWNRGGAYTGFPTNLDEGQISVVGADSGTVWYSYLPTSASTEYVFTSKAITGTRVYNLGHNIWRCNYAYFDNNNKTQFNVNDIIIRQRNNTSNEFVIIKQGRGQTFCAAYTVPKGHTCYIDRITGSIRGGNNSSTDNYFYWKQSGRSPLLRFPFTLNQGSIFFDDVDYLVAIPEGTDIIPRIIRVSTNSTIVHVSYRLLKVRN